MTEIDDGDNDRPSILLVDDDRIFTVVLREAFEARGFDVRVAHDVNEGFKLVEIDSPEYAVVDLRMPGPSGLELVKKLNQFDENTRIVVLTGYASIATAVETIKLGAVYYLTKPADADQILDALHRDQGDATAEIAQKPLSVACVEWEHIQRVLIECNGNISETARRLGMHRRTLQRKLTKRPSCA
ncbi:Acid tolerance regulatory protein ActR [Gammaproteobacteria bacterium]